MMNGDVKIMSKNSVIYEDIVKHYFPMPKGIDADDLDIPRLVEKCIAKQSGLKWIGGNESNDFGDGSDAKTATITWRTRRTRTSHSYTCNKGQIQNVGGKCGDLRIVVYDEPNECLHYFLIPAKLVTAYSTNGSIRGTLRLKTIQISYNKEIDSFGRLDRFRVKSFKDICQTTKKHKRNK
jgi:hypothetical protein